MRGADEDGGERKSRGVWGGEEGKSDTGLVFEAPLGVGLAADVGARWEAEQEDGAETVVWGCGAPTEQ